MTRATALVLTLLTGFSGLAYQISWQKYVATLLGSHSEATAAVLGLFLGGLSLGYWLFGRVTRRHLARARRRGLPPRLLLVYGALEAAIGVWALAFPLLFGAVRAVSYAIPHGPAGFGFAIDVALAGLLILPPTVLMGGTIPILTQALSRSLEDATRFHALVYAFNTVGAFAGALAAGFYLVPLLGLVRVMQAMGALNLLAGALFAAIGWRGRAALEEPGEARAAPGFAAYAAVALLVGFAMMVLQTTAIRVAALSFGPSQYTFSMVVAIFVLCIALGSFAVSAIPRVSPRHVLANQWLLVVLAAGLYFALPRVPYWAYVLRTLFHDSEAAFLAYQLQIFLLLVVIVGPVVLCSGATLPLLFHQLRREASALGQVAGNLYSWNTVGSLLGALLGGYALLFWLDMHQVFRIGVAALALAALLLSGRMRALPRPVAAVAAIGLFGAITLLAPWDPKLLSLGLFRERGVYEQTYGGTRAFLESYHHYQDRLVHYEDDPTTSVSVWHHRVGGREALAIKTNGKPDGDTVGDYTTMGLLAVVPAIFADDPKRAFVVGWGTGVTAGELGDLDSIEEVVVTEISSGVLRAAPLFEGVNRGASTNRKIELWRSDAYRALMRAEGSFDVIVSEPSNPWVNGVEMLYSREFLAAARERLAEGGVFGQWVHQYEIDEATLSLVLRTYAEVFEHVSVWFLGGPDLLLLGFDKRGSAIDHHRLEARAAQADFRAALRRAGVSGFPALLAHELLPLGVVHAAALPGPTHSLYHPRLGELAGRAFFRREDALLPFTGGRETARVGARASLLGRYLERAGPAAEAAREAVAGETCRHRLELCATWLARWRRDDADSPGLARALEAAAEVLPDGWVEQAGVFLGSMPEDGEPVTAHDAAEATKRYRAHYHHAAPFAPESLLGVWRRCRGARASATQCQEQVRAQRAASPLAGDQSLEDLLRRCRDQNRVGQACQRGLSEARALFASP